MCSYTARNSVARTLVRGWRSLLRVNSLTHYQANLSFSAKTKEDANSHPLLFLHDENRWERFEQERKKQSSELFLAMTEALNKTLNFARYYWLIRCKNESLRQFFLQIFIDFKRRICAVILHATLLHEPSFEQSWKIAFILY